MSSLEASYTNEIVDVAADIQGDFVDDIQSSYNDMVFTYTHNDGSEVRANGVMELIARCPVAAEMSPDEAARWANSLMSLSEKYGLDS